jgi:hypothetical protein
MEFLFINDSTTNQQRIMHSVDDNDKNDKNDNQNNNQNDNQNEDVIHRSCDRQIIYK